MFYKPLRSCKIHPLPLLFPLLFDELSMISMPRGACQWKQDESNVFTGGSDRVPKSLCSPRGHRFRVCNHLARRPCANLSRDVLHGEQVRRQVIHLPVPTTVLSICANWWLAVQFSRCFVLFLGTL